MRPTDTTWDAFYGEETSSLKDFMGNYYSWELFDEIMRFQPESILEVGSGTGVMAIQLSHFDYKVTSIDNNKTVLKKARENNKKFNGSVKFEEADAFKLPYKDNSYDLVYSQGLFEHFDNPEIKKLLDEQLRVAKKAVLISIPNKNYGLRDLGNERLMSSKSWYGLLRDMLPETQGKQSFPVYRDEVSNKSMKIREYQTFLRLNHPFRTIFNLLLGRKVLTIITIKK